MGTGTNLNFVIKNTPAGVTEYVHSLPFKVEVLDVKELKIGNKWICWFFTRDDFSTPLNVSKDLKTKIKKEK
jgi:hypothetical protein